MSAVYEKRLLTRERGSGLLQKFWQVPWPFVMLLGAVAAVGYVALYSAGGGPEAYASKHALRFAFSLVLMLCVGLVDIRVWARVAPLAYLGGIALLAATPDTHVLHTDVDYRGPVAVAVGTEKYGLTDAVLDAATTRVRIPMVGRVNSLNVATSAAIVLYEALRQRGVRG